MFNIRVAEGKDFNKICGLIKNELGYSNLNENEAIKRLDFFMKSDAHETFVAVEDEQVIGFIGVMKSVAYNIYGYYSQILALAVAADKRYIGVGTSLVKKVEDWSLSNGINSVCVNSGLKRLGAHSFYEKNGYNKKSFSFIKMI